MNLAGADLSVVRLSPDGLELNSVFCQSWDKDTRFEVHLNRNFCLTSDDVSSLVQLGFRLRWTLD
jgi:hypothetical protein